MPMPKQLRLRMPMLARLTMGILSLTFKKCSNFSNIVALHRRASKVKRGKHQVFSRPRKHQVLSRSTEHQVSPCSQGQANTKQGQARCQENTERSQGQGKHKVFPSSTSTYTKCGSLASPDLWKKNERMEWGGTNRSDVGLNLSGSWQQGHSATYNTPSRI